MSAGGTVITLMGLGVVGYVFCVWVYNAMFMIGKEEYRAAALLSGGCVILLAIVYLAINWFAAALGAPA